MYEHYDNDRVSKGEIEHFILITYKKLAMLFSKLLKQLAMYIVRIGKLVMFIFSIYVL